jgi:hypothetical protein
MMTGTNRRRSVIPAKAGIHCHEWTPAFAGVTTVEEAIA